MERNKCNCIVKIFKKQITFKTTLAKVCLHIPFNHDKMTLTTQSQIHNQSVATDFFNVLNSVKRSRSYDFFFFLKIVLHWSHCFFLIQYKEPALQESFVRESDYFGHAV